MTGEQRSRTRFADLLRAEGNRAAWLVLLIGLCLGLVFQGSRGLWSPDEGRYVGVALQMLDSGNYLAPAYSPAELNFSKPPLTYWIISASLGLFGRDTWAARIPYALCFGATLALLFLIGRQATASKPWLPSLVYATSAFPFLTSNVVSTDVLLTLFEALAVLGFVMATWEDRKTPRRRWACVIWLGFGLAFLTKGPPGLLPLLPMLAFSMLCGDWRAMRSLISPAGLALFVVVGLGWYAAAVMRYPWLLHYFLHDEVYGRIFTSMHRRHSGAMGWAEIYLPVLVVGTLPWWRPLARALQQFLTPSRWRQWRAERAMPLFVGLWFGIPFVIFCLSQSRLPLYLLPLFVPLALLIAMQQESRIDMGRRRTRVALLGWVILLLAIKGYAAYGFGAKADNQRAANEIAAQIAGSSYSAVIFLEDSVDTYAVEEETPWGVRLYLGKPVYGVSARSPTAPAQLCEAIRAQENPLIVVDHRLPRATLEETVSGCRPILRPLGRWQGDALVQARQVP